MWHLYRCMLSWRVQCKQVGKRDNIHPVGWVDVRVNIRALDKFFSCKLMFHYDMYTSSRHLASLFYLSQTERNHPSWGNRLKAKFYLFIDNMGERSWRTFSWSVGDVFGAFLTASIRRRKLKMRWTLENWANFLHTSQLLPVALALHAWILGECHLTLFENILTVQVATWCEKNQRQIIKTVLLIMSQERNLKRIESSNSFVRKFKTRN